MTQKKKTQSKAQIKKSPAKKFGVIILILALLGFLIINNFLKNGNGSEVKYYTFTKEGELVFSDSLGNQKIKIDLEIADTEYERQLGLMNRKSMAENQGMLFIFNEERLQSFWMLNTLISLDIIFVNKEKKIVTIHKNTTPLSQQSYPSSEPAIFVVEVVGGFCDKNNIVSGDKISWMGTRL
jgi:uncharacterized membrane protein (UPF0127 family)